jgi:multidrug transporter EmrE-like cation transporter
MSREVVVVTVDDLSGFTIVVVTVAPVFSFGEDISPLALVVLLLLAP